MKIIKSRNEPMRKPLIDLVGTIIFKKVGYEIYLVTLVEIEQRLNNILTVMIIQTRS